MTAVAGAVIAEGAGQYLERGVARRGRASPNNKQLGPDSSGAARRTHYFHELQQDAQRCSKITLLAATGAVGIDAIKHAKSAAPDLRTARLPFATFVSSFRPDWDRHLVTVGFSACYAGLFQPHWFAVLNSCDWQHILPGLPQALQHGEAFLAPLLINQLLVIPTLYWPSFFVFNGVVQQQTASEVALELMSRLPHVMKANLTFWIPAQGFQFAEVPVEQQSTYVAVVGIMWNALLSVLTSPQTKSVSINKREPTSSEQDAPFSPADEKKSPVAYLGDPSDLG
jgi:hypothetical protein